jgi:hypothetical protein
MFNHDTLSSSVAISDSVYDRSYDTELSMLVMRMLLGEPYLNTDPCPQDFSRPPCRACEQTHCLCPDSLLYNSVIDDARNFREFVVYEQDVCYPEYLITYRRLLQEADYD